MTALHDFAGVRPWLDQVAREAEQADEAARNAEDVAAAHALIRSFEPHRVSDIRQACAVLRALGNRDQQAEAEDKLQAMAVAPYMPRRIVVKPAPRIGRRMARDVLLGALVTVWAVYFLLIVVMA
jgi:hypothetical protein